MLGVPHEWGCPEQRRVQKGGINWGAVAKASGAGTVAGIVTDGVSGVFGDEALGKLATRTVANTAGGYTRRALGERVEAGDIIADAFGNALGETAVDAFRGRGPLEEVQVTAKKKGEGSADRGELDYVQVTARKRGSDPGVAALQASLAVGTQSTTASVSLGDEVPPGYTRTAEGDLVEEVLVTGDKGTGETPPPPRTLRIAPPELVRKVLKDQRFQNHDLLRGFTPNIQKIKSGGISVVREGNFVTLRARGTVSGPEAQKLIDDVNANLNVSYKDKDGTIYRTDIQLTEVRSDQKPDVTIHFVQREKSENRAASVGSDIFFDTEEGIKPGVGAHEVLHAFFGLKDAYIDELNIRTREGTFVARGFAYPGFEDSILGDSEKGSFRLRDLKDTISGYEKYQRELGIRK